MPTERLKIRNDSQRNILLHIKFRPFKVRTIQKKMQSLEGQFDCCTEQLFEVGLKLEQKEKVLFHCGFFHFGVERIRLLIIACC